MLLTIIVSSKQQNNCKKSTEQLGLRQLKSIWTVHRKDVCCICYSQAFDRSSDTAIQCRKTRSHQATPEARVVFVKCRWLVLIDGITRP